MVKKKINKMSCTIVMVKLASCAMKQFIQNLQLNHNVNSCKKQNKKQSKDVNDVIILTKINNKEKNKGFKETMD